MSKSIDEQIREAEETIQELKRKKEVLEKLSPERKLAITLHDQLCHYNHTDGCGWHYEIRKEEHDWGASTHQYWLGHANKMTCICNQENVSIESMLRIIGAIRRM